MTHLHADHAGAISEFPAATFVVDAHEWAAAADGSERDGYVRRQFDHGFDWRAGRLRRPHRPTRSPPSAARWTCSATEASAWSRRPATAPGHLSVVLRLRDREALLCGDAAYTLDAIENDTVPYVVDDEHRYRRSLREIQLYLEQTPGRAGGAGARAGRDAPARPRL